jgi:hypothetical protein
MFSCLQHHQHGSAAERDGCDARMHDAMSLVKMAQVGFTGPAKIRRVYEPGRAERRDGLEVVVFSEEQIVPWDIGDGDEEE